MAIIGNIPYFQTNPYKARSFLRLFSDFPASFPMPFQVTGEGAQPVYHIDLGESLMMAPQRRPPCTQLVATAAACAAWLQRWLQLLQQILPKQLRCRCADRSENAQSPELFNVRKDGFSSGQRIRQCTMSALAPEELESVVLKELRERFCNVYSLTMPQTSQLHLFVLHGIFMVKWNISSGESISSNCSKGLFGSNLRSLGCAGSRGSVEPCLPGHMGLKTGDGTTKMAVLEKESEVLNHLILDLWIPYLQTNHEVVAKKSCQIMSKCAKNSQGSDVGSTLHGNLEVNRIFLEAPRFKTRRTLKKKM